jgi:hypothetical protein
MSSNVGTGKEPLHGHNPYHTAFEHGVEHAQRRGRLLGFQRMTAEMRATLDPIIDAMLADDRLAERGGHVVVPDTP